MGTVDTSVTNFNENDIDQLRHIAHFPSPVQGLGLYKSACETWRCAWAPDGSYIAWSCGKRLVKLIPWNSAKNCPLISDDKNDDGTPLKHDRRIRTFDAGELIHSVAFGWKGNDVQTPGHSPTWYRYKVVNDLILAVGLKSGRIRTWNIRTGQVFLVLMDHTNVVHDLKFAPDGSLRLLSASRDGTLKLWHLDDDGNMSHTFRGPGSQNMLSCAWSPDCKLVCGVGDHRGTFVWNMDSKRTPLQLRGHVNNVCSCAFSPDGALLATASYDTTVIIWNPLTSEKLCKLYHLYPAPKEWMVGGANNNYVRYLSFNRDGRHIATVCEDGSVRVWDLLDTSRPKQMVDSPDALCCAFSPGGAAIAVGNRDGGLEVWATPQDRINLQHMCRVTFQQHLTRLQFADAGRNAATSSVPLPLQLFLKYQNLQLD